MTKITSKFSYTLVFTYPLHYMLITGLEPILDLWSTYLNFFLNDPVTRLLGLTSSCFGAVACFLRDERFVKLFLAVSTLFLTLHMHFLGSLTGSVLSAIATVRLGLSVFSAYENFPKKKLAWGFFGLYCLLIPFTTRSPIDLAGFAATQINTLSSFLSKGVSFRFWIFAANLLWLAFDIGIGAYEMAVSTFISTLFSVYALMREIKESNRKAQVIS